MDGFKLVEELKRAMLTEEKMAGMLLDLCDPEALPSEIPAEKRNKIKGNLLKLRGDSQRHAEIVSGLMARYSGGTPNDNGSAAT